MATESDVIALAGDLAVERKRLAESLRRLEKILVQGDSAAQLALDQLSQSVERLGILARTLVHELGRNRMMSAAPLFERACKAIEAKAQSLGREVQLECKANDVRLDREALVQFEYVFLGMTEAFIEYCVESPKERVARKKKPKATVQIDARPTEDGYRLTMLCDGNGLLPPHANEHGIELAKLGVRAHFEGKPGLWSAWVFYLPASLGSFRGLHLRIGDKRFCLPAWSLISVQSLQERVQAKPNASFWHLNDQMNRVRATQDQLARTDAVVVDLCAGIQTASFIVDETFEPDEVFMKPLHTMLNARGRFLGVVLTGQDENLLSLVLNPAYLVYGELDLEKEAAHVL